VALPPSGQRQQYQKYELEPSVPRGYLQNCHRQSKGANNESNMLRALGIFGLTGGFFLISQDLRQLVVDALTSGNKTVQDYSPYSYVVLAGIGILAVAKAIQNICSYGRS
jgi:hypothetical protein